MISRQAAVTAVAMIAAAAPAQAAVTISTATTENMDCSGGTCVPTATKAVLNTSDLESYLSQFGKVRVMTTGSGVEANNIEVRAAFSSPDSTSLTLEARKAITINAAVSIGSGTAELELQSDTLAASDALSFSRKGHITFGSLSDIFGINGGIFTLVGSVQGLASAVAANPSGSFALANNYDAGTDGTYSGAPISTSLSGHFEGLGNEIENLWIRDSNPEHVGLFAEVDAGGEISNVGLVDADIAANGTKGGKRNSVGALLGYDNGGTVRGSFSSGAIFGGLGEVGGLVGFVGIGGSVIHSHSSASVLVAHGNHANAAGLVGWNAGVVQKSYASGTVSSSGLGGYLAGLVSYNHGGISESFASGTIGATGGYSTCGGLVGLNFNNGRNGDVGKVSESYATGNVTCDGPGGDAVGGFAGANDHSIRNSYSTGQVKGDSYTGGFVAYEQNTLGSMKNDYWDTTSSGTDQGVGTGSSAGLQGLTTEQLQSGLPTGFDPKVWAENPNINNGLPYLINNPPPK